MSQVRPNVILITTDQQRFDGMSLNATEGVLKTPTMDSLASSGVNFTRAHTTSPVCIPARRSLLTGLHPVTHGLRGYRDFLDWDPPFTLPGLLGQNGYQTQLVGKLHLHPQRKRYGFDHMVRVESPNDRWDTEQPENDWVDWMKERGDFHPNNIGINGNGRNARPWDKEENTHLTSWTADRAVDFITKYRDPSGPFFMHLSFWAPHPPLIPPQAYWDRYYRRHDQRPTTGEWVPSFDTIPRGIPDDSMRGPFELQGIQDAMAGYYSLIHHVDDRIRYVLTRMFEYGSKRAKEPTTILFSTDHGEMLGDHHLWRKTLAYEASSHIPYFVSWRNMDLVSGSSDALVGLEDLVPTILDLCNVETPEPLGNGLDGTSFAPLLRGDTWEGRPRMFGECGGFHYMIQGRHKYLWFARTHEEQVFDLENDPCESRDLSADGELLESLRQPFEAHLAQHDSDSYDRSKLQPCANRPPKAVWG